MIWIGLPARAAAPLAPGRKVRELRQEHRGLQRVEAAVHADHRVEVLRLAPVHAVILPVTDAAKDYASAVARDYRAAGLRVELRRNWKQADSEGQRISAAKDLASNGQASLAVERDEYEGTAAMAVILDGTGHVLDYRATTIGEKQ